MAQTIRPQQLVLDIAHDTPMPSPLQRRQIIEILNSSPNLGLVAGHALVMNTTIGRGLLTAINWVVRPPFAEQVFAEPAAAMQWLKEQNPALDIEALMRDIQRAHPGFSALRW